MTPRTAWLLRFASLVAAMILATIALSWIGVLFVALVFAAIDGRESAAWEAAAAAAAGWALALLWTAVTTGARPLTVIGAAFGVHFIVLILVSIIFAAALAWSGAAVMLFVRRAVRGTSRTAEVPEGHSR